MGIVIVGADGRSAYWRQHARASATIDERRRAGVRVRPGRLRLPRHGPGHDRRRLLRPGHRQRAVGLRALAHRDASRTSRRRSRRTSASTSNFEKAKHFLEENDGAGNTFKATAKPVLIGTAVVGATTMIFSIIMALTHGLTTEPRQALDPPPAVPARPHHRRRGDLLVHRRVDAGGRRPAPTARSSSSRPTSSSTASRRRRSRTARRSSRSARSTRRRGCSTSSSTVFFSTLAFACLEPFFFIGYLISIALFGLYQAHLHGQRRRRLGQREEDRRGRAEGEGHALHAATVVGDTVGDPFKDTSSVAHEPGHQVHDAVRPARRRAGGRAWTARRSLALAGGLLRRLDASSSGARSTACASRATEQKPAHRRPRP